MVNFLTATGVPLLNQHVWVHTKKNHSVPLCAFHVFSFSAVTCCFCNYSCKGRWWSNHFIRNLTLDSSREKWMKRFLSHREIIVRIRTLLSASISSSSSWGNRIFWSPCLRDCLPPSREQTGNRERILGHPKCQYIWVSLSTAASFSLFFSE